MQCSAIKPNKERCAAKCVAGSRFCFFHDPATRDQHHEATVRGGQERSRPGPTLPPDAPPLPLGSVADVSAALAEAYNAVRTGRLGVNVGNCLAVLAQALMRAIEGGELERRLAALEARSSDPHRSKSR